MAAATTKIGVYPKSKVNFTRLYSNFVSNLSDNTGCTVSFLGVARKESAGKAKNVRALVMEAYDKHANKILQKICQEVKIKYHLNGVMIVHAVGRFKPGEPVVMVLVSSPRRDIAFRGLREAVERYKKEPALFKKEVYLDGTSAWIS